MGGILHPPRLTLKNRAEGKKKKGQSVLPPIAQNASNQKGKEKRGGAQATIEGKTASRSAPRTAVEHKARKAGKKRREGKGEKGSRLFRFMPP